MPPIEIDGARGGGQLLRMGLALATVSRQPIRFVNIRGGRPRPGLAAQHLTAVRALASVCDARVTGDALGSQTLLFEPGDLAPPPEMSVDIGTAGSITLVLQALLPCLAQASEAVSVTLQGGTNVPWSPPVEFVQTVLLPLLGRMGYRAEVHLGARGFYPRGGGTAKVLSWPAPALRGLTLLERGAVQRITGVAFRARLPAHITERMVSAASDALQRAGHPAPEIAASDDSPSVGAGCGLVLFAECEGGILCGAGLGQRGTPAEQVGTEAAQMLIADLATGAACDRFLGDQLVIWCALARGASQYTAARRTEHLSSACDLAERILGRRFELTGDGPVTVRCGEASRERAAC